MRKLCMLLGLVFLVTLTARAQDKVELFGGYSYLRLDSSPKANLNGWEISGQYKFSGWLGGVADFSGHYGSISGVSTSLHNFLFGPQISWHAPVSPFAHILLGGARSSIAGVSDTAFAVAIGAGIDTRVAPALYWRIIQGDYLATRFGGNTQNNVRVSTGVVFRF